jgi:hypothetical protein
MASSNDKKALNHVTSRTSKSSPVDHEIGQEFFSKAKHAEWMGTIKNGGMSRKSWISKPLYLSSPFCASG